MIIAVALRAENTMYGGDLIISAPPPARHFTLLHGMSHYVSAARGWEQGFITSGGVFVDREEALLIARAYRQIKEKHGPANILFSEDMW